MKLPTAKGSTTCRADLVARDHPAPRAGDAASARNHPASSAHPVTHSRTHVTIVDDVNDNAGYSLPKFE